MTKTKGQIKSNTMIQVSINSRGPKGADGSSAYQIWLEEGNVGTPEDFLESLKGDGAGTSDYNKLINKPRIDGIELVGNMTIDEFPHKTIDEEDIKNLF